MAPSRLTLLLPFELAESFNLPRLLASDPNLSGRQAYRLLEQFEVSKPEQRFVCALLRAKTNYWVFRCNQKGFCGDFIVVDMAEPDPERRRAWVLELKANEPVRPGGGVQLARHRDAVAEIAATHGVVRADADVELLRGGEDEVLAHLGVVPV